MLQFIHVMLNDSQHLLQDALELLPKASFVNSAVSSRLCMDVYMCDEGGGRGAASVPVGVGVFGWAAACTLRWTGMAWDPSRGTWERRPPCLLCFFALPLYAICHTQ